MRLLLEYRLANIVKFDYFNNEFVYTIQQKYVEVSKKILSNRLWFISGINFETVNQYLLY